MHWLVSYITEWCDSLMKKNEMISQTLFILFVGPPYVLLMNFWDRSSNYDYSNELLWCNHHPNNKNENKNEKDSSFLQYDDDDDDGQQQHHLHRREQEHEYEAEEKDMRSIRKEEKKNQRP